MGALCWIDYAMSCHYGASTGDYNSYNGYTSNVCQDWMNNKIADLEKKRDGAGKYGRIFEAQIQGFQQCTVQWDNPPAPLVDVSDFGRKQEKDMGTLRLRLTTLTQTLRQLGRLLRHTLRILLTWYLPRILTLTVRILLQIF